MFSKSKAIRARKCNTCHNEIEIGEWHGRYQSNHSTSPRNICWYCMNRIAKELEALNEQVHV